MDRTARSRLALLAVVALVAACSTSDLSVTPKLMPVATAPTLQRINATDSMMVATDVAFSDTASLLQRVVPLDSDLTASAVIGSSGGTLAIAAAGIRVDIPARALSAATTVWVTARKGSGVAYEFGPHGTLFAKPVRIQQDLGVTQAGTNASLMTGLHGGYFDTSLDSAWIDASRGLARVKETEMGYRDAATPKTLKFYVGHFSGYLVSIGAF